MIQFVIFFVCCVFLSLNTVRCLSKINAQFNGVASIPGPLLHGL